MNLTLKVWTKQPADNQDFDVDFTDYLTGHADTPASAAVSADSGITLTHSLIGNVVKLWASGGTSGIDYNVAVTMTTAGGRVKQADVVIRVREAGRT